MLPSPPETDGAGLEQLHRAMRREGKGPESVCCLLYPLHCLGVIAAQAPTDVMCLGQGDVLNQLRASHPLPAAGREGRGGA